MTLLTSIPLSLLFLYISYVILQAWGVRRAIACDTSLPIEETPLPPPSRYKEGAIGWLEEERGCEEEFLIWAHSDPRARVMMQGMPKISFPSQGLGFQYLELSSETPPNKPS